VLVGQDRGPTPIELIASTAAADIKMAERITDALRDAELLARAVVAGSTQAFADYEKTRHDLSRRLFEVTDEIASLDWTDERVQLLHRAFSSEMSRAVRALAALEPFPCLLPSASGPREV
jgi:hypothetical protein